MEAQTRQSLFAINFITGLSDGLSLSFAACIIAMPFCMANLWLTAWAGTGVALIGAIAFGMARFLGEKEEISHRHPELALEEADEEIALMQAIGIDPGLTQDMKAQMESERALWLKEIQEHELGWESYDSSRARKSGWQTAAGFLLGGVLVSLLFAGIADAWGSLYKAIPFILLLFYGLGWYKGNLTGKPAGRMAAYQLVMGLAVALAALIITQLTLVATDAPLALIDL